MKTILITGINGYLGSHLAKTLSKDYNIIGLEYTLQNLFRISECNYKVYASKDGIVDDIFSEQTIDIILHTATFYGKNNEDTIQMFNTNLYLPLNLLDKAIKYNCELFVNTDTVLDRFVNTYALTKRQFQEWLYLRKNEIKVINMQLEHFYGPGTSHTNFISTMIYKLKNNEPKIDLTLGEQNRCFIYIDDVITAYTTIINKYKQINEEYTCFQICSNEIINIKQLVKKLKELTKSESILNFGAIPYRTNELMSSDSDNSSLLNLGWEPKINLNSGLLNCINYEL